MVRQDHLELLVSSTPEDVYEHRAVVNFIDELLTLLRPNTLTLIEQTRRESQGLPPANQNSPYMELSGDPNDPEGLTDPKTTH